MFPFPAHEQRGRPGGIAACSRPGRDPDRSTDVASRGDRKAYADLYRNRTLASLDTVPCGLVPVLFDSVGPVRGQINCADQTVAPQVQEKQPVR